MVLEVTLAAVSLRRPCNGGEGARPAPGARRSTRWPRAPRGRRRGRAALHDDDRRRRREEDGPGELGDDDHTLAAVSIAEQSRERRSGRRREKPHESDEPDGGGAAVPVREHRQRDAVCPVRQNRSRPRALDPPDIGVSEDLAEGARRVPETCPQRAHAASIPRPVVFFEWKVEDSCAHRRLVGQISGGDKCERSRGNGRRAD